MCVYAMFIPELTKWYVILSRMPHVFDDYFKNYFSELYLDILKNHKPPPPQMSVSLHTLEVRLDYMGSTFLIGRLSDLLFQLKDEWKFKVENRTKIVTSQQDVV